ncbi:MAG: methyltransferase domain-containing protein [Nitrososphaerales archaeon]
MEEEDEKDITHPPLNHTKNHSKRLILGPLSDLEEHLDKEWWKHIFNSVYLKTDGDVINDADLTKREIDYFSQILNLSPENRILDLCCGHGRHSLELARRGFKFVEGLDRSHYLIRKAKKQAKMENLDIKFREGDARKLPYASDTFDTILILGNSFGYFETVKDDLNVLKEAFRVLKPWGKILIDLADGEYLKQNYQPRSWEWIDKKHIAIRERSLSLDKQRLITREIVIHSEKGILVDQIYAERLYSKESLENLLSLAGFSNITFHGTMITDSKRNQDLGMMAQRIIVSALVKKDFTPIKRFNEKTFNIVVLLGDPRKKDSIKPNHIFDDDDFYTVVQLKLALRELKEYNFLYLDNHESLLQTLLKLKPKIDLIFNLCDEGFDNDPRKELHIPALLEVLKIPYTGAGPQCLAFCYDKSLVRGVAKEMGIPIPKGIFIKPEDIKISLPFDFPVIVKPNFGDSSFGITSNSVCYDQDQLLQAISEIREKFGYDKPLIVEEFLTGKDLSVGIIGNPPDSYTVLPIVEEDYSKLPENLPKICGYEAKWLPDSPYATVKSKKADLQEEVQNSIIEWCIQLFTRLECRDYARFDWRLNTKNEPRLLEVNPNPGWCWDGHLNSMAKAANLSYSELLDLILKAAIKRLRLPKEKLKEIKVIT